MEGKWCDRTNAYGVEMETKLRGWCGNHDILYHSIYSIYYNDNNIIILSIKLVIVVVLPLFCFCDEILLKCILIYRDFMN